MNDLTQMTRPDQIRYLANQITDLAVESQLKDSEVLVAMGLAAGVWIKNRHPTEMDAKFEVFFDATRRLSRQEK